MLIKREVNLLMTKLVGDTCYSMFATTTGQSDSCNIAGYVMLKPGIFERSSKQARVYLIHREVSCIN